MHLKMSEKKILNIEVVRNINAFSSCAGQAWKTIASLCKIKHILDNFIYYLVNFEET